MISETRERFLRVIVGTIPAERIAEIHFFPPIKQGGVESGVAVIAAGDPAPPPSVAAETPPPAIDSSGSAAFETRDAADAIDAIDVFDAMDAGEDAGDGNEPDDASDHPVAVAYPVDGPADVVAVDGIEDGDEALVELDAPFTPGDAPSHDHPPHDTLADAVEDAGDDAAIDADSADELRDEGAVVADRVVPVAARSAPSMTDDIPTTPVLDDLASGEDAPAGADAEPDDEPAARRFTVFTARYRLVLKGPDRGKWEASAVAEADAPLVTVEAVVRGVQRRAGDVDDPERMSGDEVRAELARMEAAAAALRTPGALRAS